MNRESRLYLLANLKASISSTLLRWNSTLSPFCSCPGSTFSGWKLWLCTYRNSPQCCWIDDLSQYRYVFSSCTAPISHSASLCSHCRKVIPSVTSAWSGFVKCPEIIFHTYFCHCCLSHFSFQMQVCSYKTAAPKSQTSLRLQALSG